MVIVVIVMVGIIIVGVFLVRFEIFFCISEFKLVWGGCIFKLRKFRLFSSNIININCKLKLVNIGCIILGRIFFIVRYMWFLLCVCVIVIKFMLVIFIVSECVKWNELGI